MCIAILKPEGIVIPEYRLRNCFENNPDGAGFMYADRASDSVKIRKGFFTFNAFMQAYTHAVEDAPDATFGIHFRISTSGRIDKHNGHPHRIDRRTAVIHNGILDIQVPKESPDSDTVIFCRGVLSALP